MISPWKKKTCSTVPHPLSFVLAWFSGTPSSDLGFPTDWGTPAKHLPSVSAYLEFVSFVYMLPGLDESNL